MHSLLCKECVLQSAAILALLSLSFPGTLSPTTSSSVFVCLCLSVFRCLFLPCLSVSFSLCLFFLYSLFPSHFFLSVSFSMALFLCLSVFLCVSLCLSLWVSLSLCLSVCVSFCLCVSCFVCLSISIHQSVFVTDIKTWVGLIWFSRCVKVKIKTEYILYSAVPLFA